MFLNYTKHIYETRIRTHARARKHWHTLTRTRTQIYNHVHAHRMTHTHTWVNTRIARYIYGREITIRFCCEKSHNSHGNSLAGQKSKNNSDWSRRCTHDAYIWCANAAADIISFGRAPGASARTDIANLLFNARACIINIDSRIP